MGNFQLVLVDSTYNRSVDIAASLQLIQNLRLAGIESLSCLPFEIKKKLDNSAIHNREIIISCEHVRDNAPEMDFRAVVNPFLKLVSNGNYVTYAPIRKRLALKKGNWLLCTESQIPKGPEKLEAPAQLSPSCGTEFKCHVDLEKDCRWRTKRPAYVNVDRTSDNIGGSSWDGNLTRYFQAGFTTRVQYGVRAGLFPEE